MKEGEEWNRQGKERQEEEEWTEGGGRKMDS